MIVFSSIFSLKRGDILDIITRSYQELIDKYDINNRSKYFEDWRQSDDNAFDNLETIGKCILVTLLDKKPIGFVSYDPRNFPTFGIIGQNCILPEYKGRGYGRKQIEKVLEIFKEAKCKKAIASTGDNDFFIPAQKMYQSLGFKETGRHLDEKWGYQIIEYETEFNTITNSI